MKTMIPEKIPSTTFTTLRGGKGYLVEEVDAYIETIRNAYMALEEEYHAKTAEHRPGTDSEVLYKKQAEALHMEVTMLKKQLRKMKEASSSVPASREKITELARRLQESEAQRNMLHQKLIETESMNEALQTQREKIAGIIEEFRQHVRRFREKQDVLEAEIENRDAEIRRLKEMQQNSMHFNTQTERTTSRTAYQGAQKAVWESQAVTPIQQEVIWEPQKILQKKPIAPQEKPVPAYAAEKETVDYAAHFLSILEVGQKAKERQIADRQAAEVPARPTQGIEEKIQISQQRTENMLRNAHEELAEIRRQIKLASTE